MDVAWEVNHQQNGLGGLIKFLIILAFIAMAVNLSYHALITHPEAIVVKECIEKGGTIQEWIRKTDNTKVTVCLVSGKRTKGRFGLLFEKLDDLSKNTAYYFNNGSDSCLSDVEYYLRQMKASPVIRR